MDWIFYLKEKYDYYFPQPKNDTILDPLTMLLRLSLLKYMPLGSKLSIYDNCISYHESAFYQGLIRRLHGDKRDHLHNLFHPIICATEWYDIKDEHIKNIFSKARDGILTLKKSYESNSIVFHTLNLYSNILEKTCKNEDITDLIKDYTEKEKNPLENHIKKLWDHSEIQISSLLLDKIDSLNNYNDKQNSKEILDKLITGKEQKLNEIITEKSNVL